MTPFGVFRTSTAMAAKHAFELFLILALVSGCIGVDPCTDYDLMWMENGRRSSDFNSLDTSTSICDAYLAHDTWYRFEHDAGNRLIEKQVEPWYCGTHAPIWLNGTHPTDTTEITAEVCATYSSIDVCGWKGTVRIQLCNESGSEYFVYQLAVPPGCATAYCVDADSRKQCIPPLIWLQDEFKCGELIVVDPCTDYDLMWMENGRRSSDFNSDGTSTSICDAYLDHDTWYRFEGEAGNRLIEKPVEPWYCGTHAPIWLNGTHPTDTTEITAEVCATYSSIDVCGWKGTVRIQLCNESGSEYFVYLLAVPPGCATAYCVDADSRKQCIPPLIWLQDEFKCGAEQIKTSTAVPTKTSTSDLSTVLNQNATVTGEIRTSSTTPTSRTPTETPCSGPGFGPWGPWSECSKKCDHGLQTRNRTCCQPPCTGAASSHQQCAPSNCRELPEEKDKGVVLSLQSATQDTMFKVVENQQTIDTMLRTSINSICSQKVSLCCGFKIESISSASIEFVTSDDIYAAKGFPRQKSDGTVHYKIIAIVNETVNQATCSSDSIPVRERQIRSIDSNFVPFEVMEMAARNSASDILQVTGLVVKDYLDPATYPDDSQDDGPCPVATCIVPIVVCCAVIPAIAIIVGCITLHMMKKSTPKSAYGKDPKMVAPNMVHPYVNSGQTKLGSLPGKPS